MSRQMRFWLIKIGYIMRLWLLIFTLFGLSLTRTACAEDYRDLAAKGFRWVTVNGPYACPSEQEVRSVTGDPTDARELQMVEDGTAYYLVPGTLVQIVQADPENGMSEILLGGITRPLWTYTKYLTANPIHDTYGIVETPEISGLIDPSDFAGDAIPDTAVTAKPQPHGTAPNLQAQ
jgi:hypothetical protein